MKKGWLKSYAQDGKKVAALSPEDAAIATVLMERNRGKNFVDRAFDAGYIQQGNYADTEGNDLLPIALVPNSAIARYPSIPLGNEGYMSHFMAEDWGESASSYGKPKYKKDPKTGRKVQTNAMFEGPYRVYPTVVQDKSGNIMQLDDNRAYDYADETGEYIDAPTQRIASMLANKGYKKATGMPTYKTGGTVGNYWEELSKAKYGQNMLNMTDEQIAMVRDTNRVTDDPLMIPGSPRVKAKDGAMIKRADGSYSKRGLWDNIRANAGSGKKPTKEMLKQERKIKAAEKAKDGKFVAPVTPYPDMDPAMLKQYRLMEELSTAAGRQQYNKKKQEKQQADVIKQLRKNENQTAMREASYVSPAYSEQLEKQYKLNQVIKPVLHGAEGVAGAMQFASLIPHPAAQVIGGIGDVVGTGLFALETGMDLGEGKYKDAAISAGLTAAPTVIGEGIKAASPYINKGIKQFIPYYTKAANLLKPSAKKSYSDAEYVKKLINDFTNKSDIKYQQKPIGTSEEKIYHTLDPISKISEQIPESLSKSFENSKFTKQEVDNYIYLTKNKNKKIKEYTDKKYSKYGDISNSEANKLDPDLKAEFDEIKKIKPGLLYDLPKEVEQYLDINLSSNVDNIIYKQPDQNTISNSFYNNEEQELNALKADNKRFALTSNELERLKNKHRPEFEQLYGKVYTDKDLGLFAKMKNINEISRLETERKDFLKKMDEAFIQKHGIKENYTPEEELLIDIYTRGYDKILNKRKGSLPEGRVSKFYTEQVIPKLEELIKQNKLQDEQVLTRGDYDYLVENVWDANGNKLPPMKYSELQEGYEWEPNSFLSTSISDINNNSFGDSGLKSLIIAPKGQSVLYPNASGVKNFDTELEVLLPEKLRYKVASAKAQSENVPKFSELPEGHELSTPYQKLVKKDGKLLEYNKQNQLVHTYTDEKEAENIYKHTYLFNTPKFTHKITNPYVLAPFILGTGAFANSQKENKKYGGKITNNWLQNY